MFSIPAQFASIFMLLFVAHGFYRDVWLDTECKLLVLMGKVSLIAVILFFAGIMCEELIKNVVAGL